MRVWRSIVNKSQRLLQEALVTENGAQTGVMALTDQTTHQATALTRGKTMHLPQIALHM